MLISTLHNLERDGFVTPEVSPSRPPRVDYALTDLGHELLVPIHSLVQWRVDNTPRIDAARIRYDSKNTG